MGIIQEDLAGLKSGYIQCKVCNALTTKSVTTCGNCGLALPGLDAENKFLGNKNYPSQNAQHGADKYPTPSTPTTDGIVFYIVQSRETVHLAQQPEITIGRTDAHFTPTLDLAKLGGHVLGVSRQHAVIKYFDGQYWIVDAESRCGTSVNGCELEPHRDYPLENGDMIGCGSMLLKVHFKAKPAYV